MKATSLRLSFSDCREPGAVCFEEHPGYIATPHFGVCRAPRDGKFWQVIHLATGAVAGIQDRYRTRAAAIAHARLLENAPICWARVRGPSRRLLRRVRAWLEQNRRGEKP